MLRIQCQNYGIRNVRKRVDIFDKQSLDSCKINLGKILVHGTGILMLKHRTIFNRKNQRLADRWLITAHQACCLEV